MPTFQDIIRRFASGDTGDTNIPRGAPFVPAIPPAQTSTGPDIPATSPTSAKDTSTLSSIVSGFSLPDYNTPEGISQNLETILGPRPTMEESMKAARKEFGDYDVAPPNRSDYTLPPMQGPNLWGALGVLLGGGNLGAYARGAQTAQQISGQDSLNRLRAQQEYDAALRNWQAGKAGWTKEIVQSARDRMNTWRSEAATLAPYALMRQGDILKAQTEAHRAGLQYLTAHANLEYRYFAESRNVDLRQAQLQIQQTNARIRQTYNEARIAIEQGNQALAGQRLALLQQATQAKIQQEQKATQLLQTRIAQVDLQEAGRGFKGTSTEIETTVNEISQMLGSQSPANQYLLDGLNVHLQQLITQRDLYNTRLQQLQQQTQPPAQPTSPSGIQPTGQPQPPNFSSSGGPPGQVWQDPQTGHVWAPDGRGGWIFVR